TGTSITTFPRARSFGLTGSRSWFIVIPLLPVLLARPRLEALPAHFGELAAEPLEVGRVTDAVEPFEHEGHTLTLRSQSLRGNGFVADLPPADPGKDGCLLFAAQLVAGDVEAPAEDGLAALDQNGHEGANVAHRD